MPTEHTEPASVFFCVFRGQLRDTEAREARAKPIPRTPSVQISADQWFLRPPPFYGSSTEIRYEREGASLVSATAVEPALPHRPVTRSVQSGDSRFVE